MPCEPINFGNGVTGIVCTAKARKVPCCVCGERSTRLCDYATGKGTTCSAPLCERHRTIDGERDLCPSHRALEVDHARVDAEQAPVAPVGRTSCGSKRGRVPEEQLGLALGGPKR